MGCSSFFLRGKFLFIHIQGGIVNHILGQVQLLGGLLNGILSGKTFGHQLLYPGGGIGFRGQFLLLLSRKQLFWLPT